MAVEQLGLAIGRGPDSRRWPFTSGTTRGISASMRNALELSITVAPASTATGAYSRLTDAPALKKARSTSRKAPGPTGSTPIASPLNSRVRPALRAVARSRRLATGKARSSRTRISSWPTAPVAPRIATRAPPVILFRLAFPRCAPRRRPSPHRPPHPFDEDGLKLPPFQGGGHRVGDEIEVRHA